MFEKLFKLKEHSTDVKTEILAGVTTFMTMAYILAVNPNILSAAGIEAPYLRQPLWRPSWEPCLWQSFQIIRLHWRRGWG